MTLKSNLHGTRSHCSHRIRVRRGMSGVNGQTMCQQKVLPLTARSVQRCRGLAGVHKHDGYLSP
jgi:hypothetical protein